jgi:GNAT superfamily N-acetyltransferase
MKINTVTNKEELLKCTDVILELRPHLAGTDLFSMFEKIQKENFKIIYIEENNKVVAFGGYRYITTLYSNKTLYIDDLATLPSARGKGYAGKLLDYIVDEAKTNQCHAVTLDSGSHRHDAHRLYLNKRFKITAHHFHFDLSA